MKKTIPYFLLLVFLFISSLGYAQKTQNLYVYLNTGGVDAYPSEVLMTRETTATQLKLTLKDKSEIVYELNEVKSYSATAPTDFPTITSYKFNNKFNENVYTDVYATIGADYSIKATVGAIGKRLTPSFKVSVPETQVYVGDSLQISKVTRLRFDQPIHYTVTRPGYRKMAYTKIKDEEWSEGTPGGPIYKEIPLTADMLSTNLEGRSGEGLDQMLDRDESTYFHSTWGDASLYDVLPYIEVALTEPIKEFVWKYTTRPGRDNYCPLEFDVECSNDGYSWYLVKTLNENDGIPTWGPSQHYTSPNIKLGGAYRFLRFTTKRSSHRNYLVLAEFSLHQYQGESKPSEPELISPAVYDYTWHPFGREYVVDVDWLTDVSTARVPRIDINLKDGNTLESIHFNKDTYFNATINFDGGNVFPDLVVDTVMIKGRGNTSWGQSDKKPYRLKFTSSVKPFGLKKGKNWVLLANNQSGSMLTNVIGMKIARMVETAGANDIIPVELYINNEYRGHYNFTQHVGLHNNSVDIDETNAVLLELDSYFDEPYKFKDYDYYSLPVNIKSPDLEDVLDRNLRQQTLERIKSDFNSFAESLYFGEQVEKWVSPVMTAKYLLVNELSHNTELKHPKSSFLYREDLLAIHSKYIFGPVWDLDWGFGYETQYPNYSYCNSDPAFDYFGQGLQRGKGGVFFNALRNLESVSRAYYGEWKTFMERYLVELEEYIDDYYRFASPSLEHNQSLWGDGGSYDRIANRFKTWLTDRANHIYANLTPYDLSQPVPVEKGDASGDGWITMADVVCVQNYLLGSDNTSFDALQADANGDGKITVTDLVWTIAWAMEAAPDYARHMALAAAEATLRAQHFTAALGVASEVPVSLHIKEGGYTATQFDVVLPEGMTLETVSLPEAWTGCQLEKSELSEGRYRVGVYSTTGETLPLGASNLYLVVKAEHTIEQSERIVSLDGAMLVTEEGEDERISGKSVQFDMEVTGIDDAEGTEAVSGGDALHVETLVNGVIRVYTVDGRLVKVCPVTVGRNSIVLPAGVYIVNQKKVVINN